MASFLTIRKERLEQIRQETQKDETVLMLCTTIINGWPETRDEVPEQLLPYYSARDEMTVQDGFVFKGEMLVIPKSLRSEMKRSVHDNLHLGEESCLQCAQECLSGLE